MKNLKLWLAALLTISLYFGMGSAFAEEATWIDVRTQEEWNADHIPGPALIPHTELASRVGKLNLDKDAPIKLYCRSGNRAGIAKKTLEELGYSNVENVGSIDDARRLRAAGGTHDHSH